MSLIKVILSNGSLMLNFKNEFAFVKVQPVNSKYIYLTKAYQWSAIVQRVWLFAINNVWFKISIMHHRSQIERVCYGIYWTNCHKKKIWKKRNSFSRYIFHISVLLTSKNMFTFGIQTTWKNHANTSNHEIIKWQMPYRYAC